MIPSKFVRFPVEKEKIIKIWNRIYMYLSVYLSIYLSIKRIDVFIYVYNIYIYNIYIYIYIYIIYIYNRLYLLSPKDPPLHPGTSSPSKSNAMLFHKL